MRKNKRTFGWFGLGLGILLILTSCQAVVPTPAPATNTPVPTSPPATAAPATAAPVATEPPAPTATQPPVPTETPLPTATETPIPNAQLAAQVVPSMNANCRKGPGTEYFAITYLKKGKAYDVVGQDGTNSWWQVLAPDNLTCWIGDPDASLSGNTADAPVVFVPPVPVMPASFDRVRTCGTTILNVSLQWSPVTGATGYSIYRNGKLMVSVPAGVTSYEDKDAPLGIDLQYEVKAFNEYGASPSNVTNVGACGTADD
jgi:hypothetical protein